ncbi:hypothetical protein E2F50_10360 [Rhizobium deserti]|uniref:DUF6456 domain-containing protein n=1 Tax=Rhizobium deserti TaxID=2547961 RepID=A0A4R5UK54_9HYPH|nr:DUF6456 domain-containing protein [Rhizobium deserti]TDK37272.1 hypothetical protein E2F50_10360 [Rhizobium deserti]
MTKHKPAKITENPSRKPLLRLVRLLLRGACDMTEATDGMLLLGGTEGPAFAQDVVRQAQSLGLARCFDNRLAATDAAAGFLRRALVDGEEAFGHQHRDMVDAVVEVEKRRQPVRHNLSESPLGAIARMKDRQGNAFLPPEAVEAGEKLLSDFTRGQMQPRITASWEPRLSGRGKGNAGGQAEIADSAMAARDRFSKATDAMGPELAGVAVDVCCFSKGLEAVERERQWPARSAKLMLRTALLALARHYAPPAAVNPRRRHVWGAEDYRPRM